MNIISGTFDPWVSYKEIAPPCKLEDDSNWSDNSEPPSYIKAETKAAAQQPKGGGKQLKQERNKQAQKRYRERAKQKADALQHKTEALAKSLEQAEQEKRLLEAELGALRLQADPAGTCPSCQPLPNVAQAEEDFVPSVGWSGYNPDGRGGIVLKIICNPPKRLSLEQALKLTQKDVTGFIREMVFRAGQLLLEDPEGNANSKCGRQLNELVREMCGFACYMACWRPVLYQQLHCFNLADPELPAPNPPDANFYRSLLRRLGLDDQQKRRMAVAYRGYANRMQDILQQRQQLQAALLETLAEAEAWNSGRMWFQHREKQTIRMLQENVIAEHVTVFVLWGCITHNPFAFTDVQMAKFMLASWPHKADPAGLLDHIERELSQDPPQPEELQQHCLPQVPYVPEDVLRDLGLQPHKLISKRLSESFLAVPPHYRGPEVSKAFASLQF